MAVRLCGGTMRDFEALTSHSTAPHVLWMVVCHRLSSTAAPSYYTARSKVKQGKQLR